MAGGKHKPIPKLTESDLTRFWGKVDKNGKQTENGKCWEWTAGVGNGYGIFDLNGSQYQVHRISRAIAKGDPGELCVCLT